MPTASTAQILGNNESIEPYTSNIYTRRVLSGEFQVVNPHLLKDLTERGLWNEEMKNQIIAHNGSIQVHPGVKDFLRRLAKNRKGRNDNKGCVSETLSEPADCDWPLIRSIQHGPITDPPGLKTGMYYLRTKPAANPIQFTLNKEKLREREKASREEEEKERNKAAMVCSLENREECLMCGS
ncbi:RIR1 reductase, partial [Emberiza fucata]|nr:RIR1 reductase [Emberiza fucata]